MYTKENLNNYINNMTLIEKELQDKLDELDSIFVSQSSEPYDMGYIDGQISMLKEILELIRNDK